MQNEAKLFSELFDGLRSAYQSVTWLNEYDDHPTGAKRKSKVFWVHQELTEQHYYDHLIGKHILGVGPLNKDELCSFGVIDIDQYNWSLQRLDNLCNQIEKFGFPLVPARSKSGGVRLYIFCEKVRAEKVRRYLKAAASLLGFTDPLTTEIFPKTSTINVDKKETGSGITLPYFNAEKTICSGFWYSKSLSLQDFLQRALSKLCKAEDLSTIPTLHLEHAEEFNDGPPCLQTLAVNGFAQGTRSNALLNIAVYLRLKHGDDGAATHLADYNDRFMSPAVEEKDLNGIVKSANKKKYYYMCSKEPINNFCNKELCLTRKYGVGNGHSDELNVIISHISKISSDPPIWIATLNKTPIECDTDDLMSVQRFTKLCMENLHIIPNISGKRLYGMLQKVMEKIELKEAPDDATNRGQLTALFDRFLESRAPARTRGEVDFGYPFYENAHVFFRSKDFVDFLAMENHKVETRKVYKMLSDHAECLNSETPFQTFFRAPNGKTIRVWRVRHEKPRFIYEAKAEDF